jgi:enamine deaminase RidA (YjgF/YER057c/UK114 family)
MDRYQRLQARGLTLLAPPQPVASYRTHVFEGGLIYLSGQGPVTAEGKVYTGKVGIDVSTV